MGTPKGGFVGSRKRCWRSRDRKHGPGVDRKLLPQGGELYVYAQSRDRVAKERAMHRRKIETFKNLKGDLAIRPIFHQLDRRIEAHILHPA